MKFNNIYKGVLCLAAMATLAACSDLDVDIKSQYTDLPNTQKGVDAVSGAIYARTVGGGEGWFVANNNCSDVAVCVSMDGAWYDGGIFVREDLHQWIAAGGAGHFEGMWDDAFAGVVSCNTVLAQLEDPEGEMAAPARCMRAYYYFFLADCFGAVPLMKQYGEVPASRTPRSEVIQWIEQELLAVRPQLTTKVDATTYGKATRYLADALLAKIYLNWQVYMNDDVTKYEPTQANPKLNDAIAACDDVISAGKYDLSDNYVVKFMPTNGSHIKDFIYAIPFDHRLFQGNKVMRYWSYRNGHDQFNAGGNTRYPSNPGGLMRMNAAYADKFCLEGDDRNKVILKGDQYMWFMDQTNADGTPRMSDIPWMYTTTKLGVDKTYTGDDGEAEVQHRVSLTKDIIIRPEMSNGVAQLNVGADFVGRSMGYRSIKFFPDKDMTASDSHNQSNDAPIFRYADILLMKAEAILRGGNATGGDTPASLMNQIRSYVHAPLVTENPTLDELLDERAREFLDEPWRRNDLIRFGQWETPTALRALYAPEAATEKFRRLYPVAQNTLDTNPGWQQNPGY